MTCQLMRNPLGQVKFERLFKVAVLNLHVIMMKLKFKLIISAARLYWSQCVLSYPSGAVMSVVAMESRCMKTIMIHLIEKAISYYLITKHVVNICSNSS